MLVRPVIEVDKLNVRYGEFHAVKDLSFQVERGEFDTFLGTNATGKTSTLEVIEGHRTASAGTARVVGKSPTDRRLLRSAYDTIAEKIQRVQPLLVTLGADLWRVVVDRLVARGLRRREETRVLRVFRTTRWPAADGARGHWGPEAVATAVTRTAAAIVAASTASVPTTTR